MPCPHCRSTATTRRKRRTVRGYPRFSFRDVAELLLQRGCEVTHETIRNWEFPFAPHLAARLRAKRRGRAAVSWSIDETHVEVAGR